MKLTQLQKKQINDLGNKMDIEYEYEIIPVEVEEYSVALQCYSNVEEKVKRDGGKIHYGWSVHFRNVFIEAERHAVWENDDEELICITPNPGNLDEVIFLSDNTPVDSSIEIDNIRMNLTNNPLVNDWIFVANTIGEIYYKCSERESIAKIYIHPEAEDVIKKLEDYKGLIMGVIVGGRGERSYCFCSEGVHKKKFLNCHSKLIKAEIIKLLDSIKKHEKR